jgi:hypothetical protein
MIAAEDVEKGQELTHTYVNFDLNMQEIINILTLHEVPCD